MDAHILVIATPIWMGRPASVCTMVLERLDAELSETANAAHLTRLLADRPYPPA